MCVEQLIKVFLAANIIDLVKALAVLYNNTHSLTAFITYLVDHDVHVGLCMYET